MRRASRVGVVAIPSALLAWVVVTPATLVGQESPASSRFGDVSWEVRLGMGSHREQGESCEIGKGLITGGLAFRTKGPLVIGGSLDLVDSTNMGCADPSWPEEYQGEVVTAVGRSTFGLSPRLGFQAGAALELGALTVEPGARVALVRTTTNYRSSSRAERDVPSWQPAIGALLGLQGPTSRLGARLEIGRQRFPRHYYSADERVAKVNEWQPYTEVTASFPLGGASQPDPNVTMTGLPIATAVRLGLAFHRNDCVRESAVGIGLAAHSHRPLLVGMAVDLTTSNDDLCIYVTDPLPGGAEPELGGDTEMHGAPRVTTWAGYGISTNGGWLDLAPLVGMIRVLSRYDSYDGWVWDQTWQPLLGGTAMLHRDVSGFGAQLTIGKQRDPLRAYSDQGDILAEDYRWSWFFELAGTADLR